MWLLLKIKQRKELKCEKIREAITWEKILIKVLEEKLEIVGLNLDIFEESLTLFKKLKHRLSRKFQVGRFRAFHIFLESLNQKDYQWQIYTIWKVLYDMKLGEERYRLLRAMLHI